MAEQSTFARRMMAQKLMAEKRDDPFSDSPFFSVPKGQPKRISDFAQFGKPALGSITPYQVGATGSLFAPGAGIADVFGYAPDPMQSGQMLPSFGENIGQGKYLDAGLQTLGVAGDVMMAGGAFVPPLVGVGAALKAPRAARVADAAMDAADAAKIDPNQATGAAMDAAQARYFETGNYEPPTAENPVSIVPPTETEPGIIAFHGSGADFDEFRLEMIGTGEGAQAYGYGLYFTDSEDIAKFYRDAMARDKGTIAGVAVDTYRNPEEAVSAWRSAAKDLPTELQDSVASKLAIRLNIDEILDDMEVDFFGEYKNEVKDLLNKGTGKMYKVGLAPKPDELLDYDLPLSQQPKMLKKIKAGIASAIDENVAQFLKEINIDPAVSTGGDLEKALDGLALGPNAHGTKELASFGIPGIKYRAAGSRGANTKDDAAQMNYVIFDDKAVNIMEKYGIVGPVAVTAAGTAAVNRGRNDNDNGGSILPNSGVL
tara:strand:+ start:1540 stop:2994 length:1455 start_codon:yes stop_codon:yes gene_type:complete